MLALGLLHTMARGGMWGPLLGLGGLGLGAYGLSNGSFEKLLPTLSKLFAHKQEQALPPASHPPQSPGLLTAKKEPATPKLTTNVTQPQGLTLEQAAHHPRLSKFFNADGSPRFADVVKAPDEELRQGVGLLHPSARAQLSQQLAGFKPSWGQSLGAQAMGIDIEGQRKRLSDMLGPVKTAEDNGKTDPNYLTGAAYGVGGAGLLGLGGVYGRFAANRSAPSFLQMGESMWRDPAHLERFKQYFNQHQGNSDFNRLQLMMKEDPTVLRRVLSGEQVAGLSPNATAMARSLTFGGGKDPYSGPKPTMGRPGDVMLHAPVNEMVTRTGRWANVVTGNPLNHGAIVGEHDTYHNYYVDSRLRGQHEAPILSSARTPDLSFVRIRDRQLSDEAAAKAAPAVAEVYRANKNFDLGKLSRISLRDALPELQRGSTGGTWLDPVLDRLATSKHVNQLAKQVLPKDAYRQVFSYRNRKQCAPGEVCSTLAGRAAEAMQSGTIPHHDMTPGDFARQIGKRYNVQEIHLPEHMQTTSYLKQQHRERLGPLALRAPLIGGLGALGAYGLYKGYKAIRPDQPDLGPPSIKGPSLNG